MRIFLKVIGWLFVAVGVLGGGLQFMVQPSLSKVLAIVFWVGLGYYCITGKKKTDKGQATTDAPIQKTETPATSHAENKLFSKTEIEKFISTSKRLGDYLRHSKALIATGNGRSDKMYQTMLSYTSIFVYVYEHHLQYGKAIEKLDSADLQNRYMLSLNLVFDNPQAMRQCLSQLPANWQDVLTVIEAIKLSGEPIYDEISSDDIDSLTAAFNKLENYSSTINK